MDCPKFRGSDFKHIQQAPLSCVNLHKNNEKSEARALIQTVTMRIGVLKGQFEAVWGTTTFKLFGMHHFKLYCLQPTATKRYWLETCFFSQPFVIAQCCIIHTKGIARWLHMSVTNPIFIFLKGAQKGPSQKNWNLKNQFVSEKTTRQLIIAKLEAKWQVHGKLQCVDLFELGSTISHVVRKVHKTWLDTLLLQRPYL